MFTNWSLCWSHGNLPCIIAEVQDPICLKHFGCQEVLKKIDLMEGEYDLPIRFDESKIPDLPLQLLGKTLENGAMVWWFMVLPRGHRQGKQTPSLMADMYGFSCEEEMTDMKQYLREHGNYQLEQVSVKQLVTLYYFCHFGWSL